MAGSAAFRFSSEQKLRWVDLDVAGVVNNAHYWSLIEQARFDYFTRLGLLSGPIPPFLRGEATIRVESPAKLGDALTIACRVARLGGKSLEMEYRVEAAAAIGAGERIARLIATARATLVWTDAELRSTAIPDAARRAIASFEGIAERG